SGEELLGEIAVGIVLDPAPPLFRHHLTLGLDLLGIEEEIAHPVRLQPQDEVDAVGRDVHVVRGDVVGGERVVLAAVLLHGLGQLALAVRRRALEHHVLEEVGKPGGAGSLVAGTHAVPRLHRGDGVAVILEDQDAEAVVERSLRYRRRLRSTHRARAQQDEGKATPRQGTPGRHEAIMLWALAAGNSGDAATALTWRCSVILVYLTLAALLEVSGDFLMRMGLGGQRWALAAGAAALATYGVLVNQPAWAFGRTLGLYIVVFFVASQLVAFLVAGERPSA